MKLPDCCLEKGESNVKNSGLLCLKGKEGKCKATCSRTMASSSTGLCSCCPDLSSWRHRTSGGNTEKKERGRKLWKVVKNSILGLKIQHLWADRELLGQGRQRNEVVLGSVLRGMWHWEAQWGCPHTSTSSWFSRQPLHQSKPCALGRVKVQHAQGGTQEENQRW